MLDQLTLSRAAIEFGGTLMYPDCHFGGVSTDTRTLADGQLFVALRGDNYDAHNFLSQAAEHASGLVVERPDRNLQIPQWVVPDTTVALGQVARLNRSAFSGELLAVTGSAGKTTVKEMLAAIFSRHLDSSDRVLATRGNLNNHIGVPLTLLELGHQHRYAVVEMGASGPGEISWLCQLAQPDVTLINNVLPAHVEGFGSIDGIAAAKGEIYSSLKPSGTAVLNMDQPYVSLWRELIGGRRCLSYSLDCSDADVHATDISADSMGRCSFQLHSPEGCQQLSLGLSGRHNVANALAAATAALAVGVGLGEIAAGLASVTAVSGRMELKQLATGDHLIDDSYNANPGSVKAATDALLALPGTPILVLGDMGELGADEIALHGEVGSYAASAGVEQLLTVGVLSAHSSAAFGPGGQHYQSKQELIYALRCRLGEGIAVLVKGSRSAGMEDVVNALEAAASKGE